MIESLALDALLLVIIIAVVPIGMYRGGVREVCTSAGLLLGILLAQQWSDRWGDWIADVTGIDLGVSRFIAGVLLIVAVTGLIGYGAAASFGHRPGPGGRMFGGLIALANAIIFLGALVQYVADDLYEGIYPDIIRQGYLSRAISVGFDWVLLGVTGFVVLGILFGMVVRERDVPDEEILVPASAHAVPSPRRTISTVSAQPDPTPAKNTEEPNDLPEPEPETGPTVRVREVRHWEEPVPSTLDELQAGWTRTWPTTVTSTETTSPRRSGRGQRLSDQRRSPARDQNVVRDWLKDDPPSGVDE
jgi:hypothetical protein